MALSCSHVLGVLRSSQQKVRITFPASNEKNALSRSNRSLPEPWIAPPRATPSPAGKDIVTSRLAIHFEVTPPCGRHARPLLPIIDGQWHCTDRLATTPVEPMSPDLSPFELCTILPAPIPSDFPTCTCLLLREVQPFTSPQVDITYYGHGTDCCSTPHHPPPPQQPIGVACCKHR
jgi:hypothetical protein